MTEDICMKCAHRNVCSFYEPGEECGACNQFMPKTAALEIDENFETMLICAERYALGRKSYMPSLVIGYITPLIPKLSLKTLRVMERDLDEAGKYGEGGYGDETIDKPGWIAFLGKIRDELKGRTS